jgi:hypothetical protein
MTHKETCAVYIITVVVSLRLITMPGFCRNNPKIIGLAF